MREQHWARSHEEHLSRTVTLRAPRDEVHRGLRYDAYSSDGASDTRACLFRTKGEVARGAPLPLIAFPFVGGMPVLETLPPLSKVRQNAGGLVLSFSRSDSPDGATNRENSPGGLRGERKSGTVVNLAPPLSQFRNAAFASV